MGAQLMDLLVGDGQASTCSLSASATQSLRQVENL
jgi:hypothetical protein